MMSVWEPARVAKGEACLPETPGAKSSTDLAVGDEHVPYAVQGERIR